MKSSIIFLLSFFMTTMSSFNMDQASGYKVGDKVLDFSLMNIDGKYVSPTNYADSKGIILIFTCNHCPFSVAYEDRIISLHKNYVEKGYPVLAINANDPITYPADSYENMKERASEKAFPFAYVFDETQQVAKAFGALKTPHVFILSHKADGFYVEYIGAIDDNSNEPELIKSKYAENALNALIRGEKIAVTTTKAVGCGIKWKK